jgi:hypothetical protein
VDIPFEISIAADTETAFEFGHLPGLGRAFVNNSEEAIWTVDGLGTATSDSAQIYTLPGVARVGFGWNGELLPVNTDQPAERHFSFRNSAFALDSQYGRLNAVVPAITLTLVTDLRNPPGVLPVYSTSIHFPGEGGLILKELRDLSYSVVAVPEPPPSVMDILAFFDNAVVAGELFGDGPTTNSAGNRLKALRNMLEAAADPFELGELDAACDPLEAALRKADGSESPPDFVTGPSALRLAMKIEELRRYLECD